MSTYAAHARANARVCSLGKEPDVTSSRVCLPPSSLMNESSQYVCGTFVKAILTVSCSRKIGHRQLMLLPSKMLICAAREVLIVTVEMVNYYRVFENQLGRASTADEADHGNQQRYRGPLHRAAIRPCFSAS